MALLATFVTVALKQAAHCKNRNATEDLGCEAEEAGRRGVHRKIGPFGRIRRHSHIAIIAMAEDDSWCG